MGAGRACSAAPTSDGGNCASGENGGGGRAAAGVAAARGRAALFALSNGNVCLPPCEGLGYPATTGERTASSTNSLRFIVCTIPTGVDRNRFKCSDIDTRWYKLTTTIVKQHQLTYTPTRGCGTCTGNLTILYRPTFRTCSYIRPILTSACTVQNRCEYTNILK